MKLRAFVIGLTLGAISWAIVPLVSNNFEPFDSSAGFYIGQAIMSVGAFYFAYSKGIKNILLYILGIYIGQNIYAYIFGTSNTRSWALLLLITSLVLCVYPLIAAIIGKILNMAFNKSKQI